MAFLRNEGARNVGQGADHFGEHGEGPEEEGLNGRGRIFRRSEGGATGKDRDRLFRRTYYDMHFEGHEAG